jgi:hypothetical protein
VDEGGVKVPAEAGAEAGALEVGTPGRGVEAGGEEEGMTRVAPVATRLGGVAGSGFGAESEEGAGLRGVTGWGAVGGRADGVGPVAGWGAWAGMVGFFAG